MTSLNFSSYFCVNCSSGIWHPPQNEINMSSAPTSGSSSPVPEEEEDDGDEDEEEWLVNVQGN